MGTMGLALPWKARIASVPRQRETRVEPSEHYAGGPNPAVVNAITEDAALAAGCRAGNLHAYERLFSLHGARMKNLARNLLGNPVDAEDAVQETFLKVQRSIASFRGQSSFITWDLSDSDQHLPRRAPQPFAQERSSQRRLDGNAAARAARPGCASIAAHRAGARAWVSD